jgi:large-conductance mechanosensitive channel
MPLIPNNLNVLASPLNVVTKGTNTIEKIMVDFNVIGVALGVLIGNNIVDLVNALNEGVIMPSIQPFLNRLQINTGIDKEINSNSDTAENEVEDSKGGIKFNFNSLFTPLIKFITISLIVLIFLNLGTSLLDTPSTNVVIIGVEPGVKLNGK